MAEVESVVTDLLSRANSEMSKIWEDVVKLLESLKSEEFHSVTQRFRSIALRRSVAYNPCTSIETNPLVKKGIEILRSSVIKCTEKLKKNENDAEAFTVLGNCYLLLDDFPNAFSAYTRANGLRIEQSLSDPWFFYAYGCVLQHFSYHNEARDAFSKIRNLNGFALSAEVKYRLALLMRATEAYGEALTLLQGVVANPPEPLKGDDIKLQIAFTHQQAGDMDSAKVLYNELYTKYPMNLELIQQYCWFLSIQKDPDAWDLATTIVEKSKTRYPSDPMLTLITGRILLKQDKMKEAYADYCKCISYWSDCSLFWCGLGVLYLKADQRNDARVALERANSLSPDMVEAYVNLGLINEIESKWDAARQIYAKGLVCCKDVAVLNERFENMGRGQQKIMEANDSKFFVQPADKLAKEYITIIPPLPPANIIGTRSEYDTDEAKRCFNEMALMRRSIFE